MRGHPYRRVRTGINSFAWYEREDGARLLHDKAIVANRYPGLNYQVREADGAMELAGMITLVAECGVPTPIGVRIVFPPNYPQSEPRAYDSQERFPHDADHHFYPTGQCCLWLRPESKWNPADPDALAVFLDEVAIFFDRQLVYEATGETRWPGGQRAHSSLGYVEFVLDLLGGDKRLLTALTPTFANVSGIGRNSPCPCGSGLKFKRCHLTAVENIRRQMGSQDLYAVFREVLRHT